ncbi:hypothetical protein M422DRAFT_253589 [Sphaerobolus stellatus SS14]|uniref:Uncharacterized protein n=1 Tax=Sphaerobolus stellatus (strain SS14) TaxID=990650 RepID=A0A0C9VMK5_SPHS4|nr:hypothetical protein M422DRAFT_253589 [Sphaerobolus stellatus SS14]
MASSSIVLGILLSAEHAGGFWTVQIRAWRCCSSGRTVGLGSSCVIINGRYLFHGLLYPYTQRRRRLKLPRTSAVTSSTRRRTSTTTNLQCYQPVTSSPTKHLTMPPKHRRSTWFMMHDAHWARFLGIGDAF